MRELYKFTKLKNIRIIPKTEEYEFSGLKFIDSFSFMTESLNKLTEYLRTKNDTEKYDLSKFRLLEKHFQQYSEQLKLLIHNGVYPYE